MLEEAGDGESRAADDPGAARRAARPLEPAERELLERGAVEGEVFHRGAVQALAPDGAGSTRRLTALVRKELVRPTEPQLAGEDAFRFRHLLIRDAAYDALPKATRAELHERFARWLDGTARSSSRSTRSSATTWSRPTATGRSSARKTSSSACGRRNGSQPPAVDRSRSETQAAGSACSGGPSPSRSRVTVRASSCCSSWPAGSSAHGELREGDALREEAVALATALGDRDTRAPRAVRARGVARDNDPLLHRRAGARAGP